ncbi:hypothetical protein [Runella zeae]|jgi:hypothetical protein|uniref:hypothetical protein n=1 Tax=Runella zeae TaxID=94255 RepID=UPI0003FE45C8|nr:hypothetical protein [Runella zeae]
MARYSLDYSFKNTFPSPPQKRNYGLVWGIGMLLFAFLFFGGIGTAFHFRNSHLSLVKAHNRLKVSYDSLHSAKQHADYQLYEMKAKLQQLGGTP